MAWLKAAGLGPFAEVEPGPLLRASHGDELPHMPWTTDSVYDQLAVAMDKAFAELKRRGMIDKDLQLEGRDEPDFATHSMRRYSGKTTKEYSNKTLGEIAELSDTEVTRAMNYFHGWGLPDMLKEMLVHYAGMDMIQRGVLSLCTIMM